MSRTRIALACAAGLLAAASTVAPAFAQDKWHPSKWGADDEIGAANLLTPAKVLEAAKLVKTGKAYPLGIVVGRDTPAFPPRSLAVTVLSPNQYQGSTLAENKMSYNDDMITGWLGVGTQIDGLGHLGIDNTYYNGNQAKDFVKVTGLEKLGIDKIPPIVTRGVLIDMAKHKGVEAMKEGDAITADDVKAAMQAQKVTVGKGDVVVFHTGWLSMLAQDPKRFGAGEPGIDAGAATYLASLEPVAVGADTWGIEAVPFAGSRIWEGHQILLAKNGIYILETLDTRALIKDGVTEFLFVLGQPRYKGAVQAIINPVAIN
ncbi:kynurenine formamidase [Constrictibacter sp. MBR-5]|jgi:kynurenine formamidase|uniref:cyclase family protein n=1 Tax=Constrictibacter sp. MBR-5 TaxID=3156467 RepID=UPI003394C2DC